MQVQRVPRLFEGEAAQRITPASACPAQPMAGCESASHGRLPDKWGRQTTWPSRRDAQKRLRRPLRGPVQEIARFLKLRGEDHVRGVEASWQKGSTSFTTPLLPGLSRVQACWVEAGSAARIRRRGWLLIFQANLACIEERKSGFVLQIQAGHREVLHADLGGTMGKTWNIPHMGLFALRTKVQGGARVDWEEGSTAEVDMVAE